VVVFVIFSCVVGWKVAHVGFVSRGKTESPTSVTVKSVGVTPSGTPATRVYKNGEVISVGSGACLPGIMVWTHEYGWLEVGHLCSLGLVESVTDRGAFVRVSGIVGVFLQCKPLGLSQVSWYREKAVAAPAASAVASGVFRPVSDVPVVASAESRLTGPAEKGLEVRSVGTVERALVGRR
jgi:hypothetical protein